MIYPPKMAILTDSHFVENYNCIYDLSYRYTKNEIRV